MPSHAEAYNGVSVDTYEKAIRRIAIRLARTNKDGISVMDIVGGMTTDPHLTTNNKRVAVRRIVPRMLKDGIEKCDEFSYIMAAGEGK